MAAKYGLEWFGSHNNLQYPFLLRIGNIYTALVAFEA